MKRIMLVPLLVFLFSLVLGALLFAQESETAASSGARQAEGSQTEAAPTGGAGGAVWKYFAAALAVGVSCIAGGIAVGQIGAAAMGAMSENPELSGKAMPYAGLAEGICLWGFLVAVLIILF